MLMGKHKLNVDDQVAYMRDNKGILFNITNEEAAKKFLTYNNYYFKVKSYAKNYDKYIRGQNAGRYVNLEFAHLQELSTIDMHFRKFIIKITLDIEHFLKTQMLRDFMGNETEDGYAIINELILNYPYIAENISNKAQGNNSACKDLVSKYNNEFAIWNIVEVLSFGDFIKLYELYYKKYPNINSVEDFLWSVKFLRNAAAHNNCLLNSLKNTYTRVRINKKINTFVSKIDGVKKEERKKKMANPVIHDFIVTLYVFNHIVCSEKLKTYTMEELKELINNRMTRNKSYFEKNQVIVTSYNFIKKVVDYFYSNCI